MDRDVIDWTSIGTAFTNLWSSIAAHVGAAGRDPWSLIGFVLLVAFVNFVPTIVALVRKHRSAPAISALNLLFGWTLLGWVLLLVWAAWPRRDAPQPETSPVLDAVFAASINSLRREPVPDAPPRLVVANKVADETPPNAPVRKRRCIIGLDARHPIFGTGTVLEVDASHDSADVQFAIDGRKHTVILSELVIEGPTAA
jgi:hypothetical protein